MHFQIVKVNWKCHQKYFIFVKLLYVFFLNFSECAVPPEYLLNNNPLVFGKQWVWPWEAASTVHSGSCSFFLLSVKKPSMPIAGYYI